jgi:hypothetical protein
MSTESKVAVQVPGFCTLLFLLFLTLKLCNVIQWSWWWVTAPLWGPWAIVLLVLGIALIVLVLSFLLAVVLKAIEK